MIREIDHIGWADGCKVYFVDDSWVTIRFSGTEPVMRVFAEAPTEAEALALTNTVATYLELEDYMTLTTAVVMARGLGTRMRAAAADEHLTPEQAQAAAQGAKAMMPLGGRPFLDHSLTALADAGITDVCLVIGPEHQAIRDYYDAVDKERLTIGYAIQDEPLGTANAVAAAESYVSGRRFVVVNGDNYYDHESLAMLAEVEGHAALGYDRAALIEHSNIPAERVASFALLDVDAGNKLVDVLEKPEMAVIEAAGEHALISMNCWAFTPDVFDACRQVQPSPRGEYEIQDAVRLVAASQGLTVVPVAAGVYDLGRRDDIAAVEAAMAQRPVRL